MIFWQTRFDFFVGIEVKIMKREKHIENKIHVACVSSTQ